MGTGRTKHRQRIRKLGLIKDPSIDNRTRWARRLTVLHGNLTAEFTPETEYQRVMVRRCAMLSVNAEQLELMAARDADPGSIEAHGIMSDRVGRAFRALIESRGQPTPVPPPETDAERETREMIETLGAMSDDELNLLCVANGMEPLPALDDMTPEELNAYRVSMGREPIYIPGPDERPLASHELYSPGDQRPVHDEPCCPLPDVPTSEPVLTPELKQFLTEVLH